MSAKTLPQELKLATSLLNQYYGDELANVFRAVCEHQQASLQTVIRATGLRHETVAHILLCLLKHNFVLCHRKMPMRDAAKKSKVDKAGAHRRLRYIYVPNPSYLLVLWKFPKWLVWLQNEYGHHAESLIQTFAQEGRLDERSAISKAKELYDATSDEPESEDEQDKELSATFASLVQDHLIERAPSLELPPPWYMSLDTNIKRGHKSLAKELETMNSTQERTHELYNQNERLRFEIEGNGHVASFEKQEDGLGAKVAPSHSVGNGANAHGGEGGDTDGNGNGGAGGGGSGGVHAKIRSESGRGGGVGASGVPTPPRKATWRINVSEFEERFREDLCIETVGECTNDVLKNLFAAVIAAFRRRRHMGQQQPELVFLTEIRGMLNEESDALDTETKVSEAQEKETRTDRDKGEIEGCGAMLQRSIYSQDREGDVAWCGAVVAVGISPSDFSSHRLYICLCITVRSFHVMISLSRARARFLIHVKVLEGMRELESVQLPQKFIRGAGGEKSDADGEIQAQFLLDLDALVRLIKLNRIDTYLEGRFGVKARRIAALLRRQNALEEKDIAMQVMLPVKETREVLYKLYKW